MRIFTVLVFMAVAAALGQTARLGDLGPDSTVVTNAVAGGVVAESDPVALASLAAHTNASSAHTADQVGAVPGTAGTGGHSLGVDIYRGGDIARTTLSAGGVAVKSSLGTTTFGKDGIVKSTASGVWTLNSTGASLAGFGVPEPWSFAWADLIQRPEMVATNAAIFERLEEKADKTDIGKWSDIAAAAVAGSGHAIAEQVVSGAVCTASAGNRYFWTSATNVVLSVNLTSGQVVNLAKLNNTATNSITAIGQVGWEWTGGDMTNTIAAGKSMTFGFLIDAATGKTNAYATGVSK